MPRVDVARIANLAKNRNRRLHRSRLESRGLSKNPFLPARRQLHTHLRFPCDSPRRLSNVPCPLPRRTGRVHMSIASLSARPSPPYGRVGIRIVTFEACSDFTRVQPAGSLDRPKRPLSRGSSPSDCSSRPLVGYRINRQLCGWNLPPLAMLAVGAHRRV